MYKNIRKELDLINSNNQISEKLMILVLYNELYNMFEIYNSLYSDIAGRSENEFLQSYVPFMKKLSN